LPKHGTLPPDTVFHGRYRVVRCIKAGGMGAVYEVLDEKTNGKRALKVMLPGAVADKDLRARFELEARVTGSVESDHIVRVSDAGVDAVTETPFLVMDLLRGHDLGQVVEEGPPLTAAEAVLYLGQAAMALDKTHAASIVHRDLKPENIFVTRRDDGSISVKVLDFGIAKVMEHRTHATGTRAMGTPTYMSPEQIRGDGAIGPATDIYALGQIAYALLVGEEYWHEEAVASNSMFAFFLLAVKGLSEPATVRAQRTRVVTLPEAFDAWFFRACAADPAERFPTAGAAVVALAEVLEVAPPVALVQALPIDAQRAVAALTGAATVVTGPQPPARLRSDSRGEDAALPPPARLRTDTTATLREHAETLVEPAPRASSLPPAAPPRPRALGVAIGAVALGLAALVAWRVVTPAAPAVAPARAATGVTDPQPPAMAMLAAAPPPEVTPSVTAPPPPAPTALASASAPSPATASAAPRRPPPPPAPKPSAVPTSKPHGLL
jgi:serine/threonine-protein kinase